MSRKKDGRPRSLPVPPPPPEPEEDDEPYPEGSPMARNWNRLHRGF